MTIFASTREGARIHTFVLGGGKYWRLQQQQDLFTAIKLIVESRNGKTAVHFALKTSSSNTISDLCVTK